MDIYAGRTLAPLDGGCYPVRVEWITRKIIGREKVVESEGLVVVGETETATATLAGDTMTVTVVGGGGVFVEKSGKSGWVIPPMAGRKQTVMSGKVAEGDVVRLEAEEAQVEIQITNPKSEILNKSQNLNSKFQNLKLVSWIVSKLPRREGGTVYLTKGLSRDQVRKRTRMMGVAFVVVVAAVLVWGQVKLARQRVLADMLNKKIDQIAADFVEARNLVDLNPIRSKILAERVKLGIEELDEKSREDKRLAEAAGGIGAVLGAATGVRPAELTLTLDLTLVRQGARGAQMVKNEGKLLVLDVEGARIVEVDPNKKSGNVILGEEAIGEARLAATYPGKLIVLTNQTIKQCPIPNPDKCLQVVEFNQEVGEISDAAMFGGNIYLLDAGKKMVWRYLVTEKGYGDRQAWLAEGETLTSEAQGLAIDGAIWVVGGGQVEKFVRGVKDNFAIDGLAKPLGNRLKVAAEEDGEKVYVLDAENLRLVVIGKDGKYEAQYQEEKLGSVIDVVADEEKKKVYLLAPDKVWEMGIE